MRAAIQLARQRGRQAGYAVGWKYGYHIGHCEAIMQHHEAQQHNILTKKVIYVTAGIDVPYPAIDQAIIKALKQLVAEVVVANPADNVTLLAENVQPDAVLVLNGVVFPAEQVIALRERGIKTAVWFTDDPYYTDWTIAIAPNYDYVFTLELSCVELYRSLGCANVYYMPFAADADVYRPHKVDYAYQSDICFIGTAFWNRVQLIDEIAPYLLDKKVIISGWWWDRLTQYKKLASKIRLGEWMDAKETARYYSGAKIVINLHRLSDDDTINFNSRRLPALSLNPRTFEIAGCGTLQLTDVRDQLSESFVPGLEIETYTNSEELITKLDYYLHQDEEREQIAVRALSKMREEHTYIHRLTRMLHTIFGVISPLPSIQKNIN